MRRVNVGYWVLGCWFNMPTSLCTNFPSIKTNLPANKSLYWATAGLHLLASSAKIFTIMQKVILFLAAFALLTLDHLYASNVKTGKEVIITEPVDGNFYAAAGQISIQAPINGDLVCAAGNIKVAAPVAADILLCGGEVTISSPVASDVRLAGGKVMLEANVGGDLVITGGELRVREGVQIAGDVYIAGGKVVLDGTVSGDLKIAGGEVFFNGTINGSMDAKGGKIFLNGAVQGSALLAARELNIGSKAAFYSRVEYWNESGDVHFEGKLYNGATARYNEDLKFQTKFDREIVQKGFAAFAFFRFASAALLMMLLVLLFGPFFDKNAGTIRPQLNKHLGIGSLLLVGTPLAALLAFITVIGIPIGFILISGYSVVLMLANSVTAVVAAYELKKYYQKSWNKGIVIAVAIGVFFALRLVSMAAFPGKLAVFAVTAIALGAVAAWLRRGWQKQNDTPDATPSRNDEEPSDLV